MDATGKGGRTAWRTGAGAMGPGSHSPRAWKTRTLLESDEDTLRTSLCRSNSSSGPSQVSTMGDMSCRSGGAAPLRHLACTPPAGPPPRPGTSVTTIQGHRLAAVEIRLLRFTAVLVTVHQQNGPVALGAPAPGLLWQIKRAQGRQEGAVGTV